MKRSILNIGKELNRGEQKEVLGGISVGFKGPACHKILTEQECNEHDRCMWGTNTQGDGYCDGNVPHIVL